MSDPNVLSRRENTPGKAELPPTLSASETEAAPRPKVLRRPPQFSRVTSAPSANPAPSLPAISLEVSPPVMVQPATPGRAWQEDVRFGLALIASLFLINLAFILLIPQIPTSRTSIDESTGTTFSGNMVSMPQAVGKEPSDVTMYSEPDAEKDSAGMFDLNNVDPKQNAFSVSPKDIPPPTASPLTHEEQEQ